MVNAEAIGADAIENNSAANKEYQMPPLSW